MLSIAYITIILLMSFLLARYVPMPTFTRLGFGGASVLLTCFISAAIICWHLPTLLHSQLGLSPEPEWLTRMAQVIGAGGGFYIALRGLVAWGLIFVFGLAGAVVYAVVNYIVGF
jgi:hypothetical protein